MKLFNSKKPACASQHSHAGAWERDTLAPTLLRGSPAAFNQGNTFMKTIFMWGGIACHVYRE